MGEATCQNGYFVQRRGTDKENLRKRIFYRCLSKAGLRRVRIHDLRHTYASSSFSKANHSRIKDQLEYHSIHVTVDIYGHLVPAGTKRRWTGSTMRQSVTSRNCDTHGG
jgi:integrase